ncbi:unnamed protein product [Rhizophagus irregularis]|nr:unnamed protein product [Rhizophagus irregularis]
MDQFILNQFVSDKPRPCYKVLLSEREVSNITVPLIIVLCPEKNKYLSWEMCSPQQIAEKRKKIIRVNAFTIFRSDCNKAILESQGFVKNFHRNEIAKAIADIWNITDENVKNEYCKLSKSVQKLRNDFDLTRRFSFLRKATCSYKSSALQQSLLKNSHASLNSDKSQMKSQKDGGKRLNNIKVTIRICLFEKQTRYRELMNYDILWLHSRNLHVGFTGALEKKAHKTVYGLGADEKELYGIETGKNETRMFLENKLKNYLRYLRENRAKLQMTKTSKILESFIPTRPKGIESFKYDLNEERPKEIESFKYGLNEESIHLPPLNFISFNASPMDTSFKIEKNDPFTSYQLAPTFFNDS